VITGLYFQAPHRRANVKEYRNTEMKTTALACALMFVAILKGLAGSAADPWISDLVSQGWQWYGHPDGSSDYDHRQALKSLARTG